LASINQTINRIAKVQISRDKSDTNSWLIKIPQQAITALNKSTALGYGTSFDHNTAVQLYMVGGGTWAGVAGTSIGIFIGTSISG